MKHTLKVFRGHHNWKKKSSPKESVVMDGSFVKNDRHDHLAAQAGVITLSIKRG
jgi:hypothetical protein